MTQASTSTIVPQYLREKGQRDPELAVTTPAPGANCDAWPAGTSEAAIMTIQNVTGACNGMQQCLPCPAWSGRGGNHQRQTEARCIQTRITSILQIIDSPNRRFG